MLYCFNTGVRDALIHSAQASPVLSVRRAQDHRRRQTGRLSRRWAEGMRTDRAGPDMLNFNDGVMPRRPAGCAAWFEKAPGLPCTTHHSLRAFWASCRLRRMDQSVPK
jgi:hypothetical protein